MSPARPLTFSLLAMIWLSLPAAWAEDFDDAISQHIEHPDWFESNPFNDLEEVLETAKSNEKQGLMVLFTTEGCSYCERFIRVSLGNPKVAARVQAHFASVGLEIFDDREMTNPVGEAMPIKQFAQREGAGFAPTLLFYGEGGKRLVRQVGYQSPERFGRILDYILNGHAENESLRDYLRRIAGRGAGIAVRTGLRDDPLFIPPPFALDRSRYAAEQPLLVIFEKAGCESCNVFHSGVLARKDIRELLGQFEVVRLDAEDSKTPVVTPEGRQTTAAAWFEQTSFSRLPALLFFDEKGTRVLETDALVGRARMLNSVHFVLQRAYEKDWTYQRFARSRAIEKLNRQTQ